MSDSIMSPQLPVNDGIVSSAKEFADALTMDLTDEEIKKAFELTVRIANKWHNKFRLRFSGGIFTPEEALEALDEFEEELKYELATKLDVYATVDATPVFEGNPPIVEFSGALPSHDIAKYGFDHEKQTALVQKATARDEAYYGQKGITKKKKK